MLNLINQSILNEAYQQVWQVRELRRQFLANQYVHFQGLFAPEIFSLLKSEAKRLEPFTMAKNYRSGETATPRHMRVFGGIQILEKSPLLGTLYVHHELRGLLSGVVDGPVYNSNHSEEVIGVHFQNEVGHTHGWHLDDNGFLFVIVIEAPPMEYGGTTESIPNWEFHAKRLNYSENKPLDEYVTTCREENLIHEYYHAAGDAY